MIAQEFSKLFIRDLDKLMTELESYSVEESLWVKVDGINNSAGNLIMHLCGNLQHFIGAILGETGYERKRDFEFNGHTTVVELEDDIMLTKKVIADYFNQVDEGIFSKNYPLEPFGYSMTVNYFLIHLHGHLNYHLGQVNYHRRILS
jgi:uncharacterized damage-inducible protein DinB